MKIIDLTEAHQPLYFLCLEDWSDEICECIPLGKEAGNHKEEWYHKIKDKGLRVKLALDDEGTVGGMIQYLPIEHSTVEGKDLYFIYCIWVHGHKKGQGNFQKRGMGKALLQAAEEDAKALGAKGIAAWGISLPFWMKASWFKKHGYKKVDKDSIRVLLWKPFTNDAVPPKWIRQKKSPTAAEGKVTVTAFKNGWCPAMNLTFERAKRAAAEPEFSNKVIFNEIDTFDKSTFNEWLATTRRSGHKWGISDGVFINDKEVRTGPPPSYDKIKKLIKKRVKKLN